MGRFLVANCLFLGLSGPVPGAYLGPSPGRPQAQVRPRYGRVPGAILGPNWAVLSLLIGCFCPCLAPGLARTWGPPRAGPKPRNSQNSNKTAVLRCFLGRGTRPFLPPHPPPPRRPRATQATIWGAGAGPRPQVRPRYARVPGAVSGRKWPVLWLLIRCSCLFLAPCLARAWGGGVAVGSDRPRRADTAAAMV